MRLACGCDAEKCAHDPGVAINYCNDYIFIADRTGILHRKFLNVNRNRFTPAHETKARKEFDAIHATLFQLLDTRFPGGWRQRTTFIGAEGVRVIYEPQASDWDAEKQEPYILFGLDEEFNLSMSVCNEPASFWYGDTKTDQMAKFAGIPFIDLRNN